jgi:hypothetical protein
MCKRRVYAELTTRHCECVYYQDWHRTRPVRPPPEINFKPAVHRLPALPTTTQTRESIFSNSVARDRDSVQSSVPNGNGNGDKRAYTTGGGLPFDEEAKLVYGVILSLRNMVKKLSGK